MERSRQPLVTFSLLLLAGWGVTATPAEACSTFCLRHDGGVYFGKNYDWHIGEGMLIVNPRNLERVADVPAGETPARWVSRYGSVTFNQYGRDFPMGGMNEAGLVIELMWLDGTRYPAPDDRSALSNLQWIQHQLDMSASVDDAVASDAYLRVLDGSPLHYLAADRTGSVATIEFLGGRMVAHTGESLPVAVLTNSVYSESVDYLRSLDAREGAPPPGPGSLARFARAAQRVRAYSARDAARSVDYAFETLKAVSQGRSTQWSIVYDLSGSAVHFRTGRSPAIKTIDLDDLDFSCRSPVLVLDLNADLEGDIREAMVPYSTEANRDLIRSTFAGTPFLANVPDVSLVRRAAVPERAACLD